MPKRAMTICRKPGCNELVPTPGYCSKHKNETPFRSLENRKSDEDRRFYNSYRWQKTSREHRRRYPLCSRCSSRGYVVPVQLVHHDPDRKELIRLGISPYDHDYLHSLCNRCHMEDLRAKR